MLHASNALYVRRHLDAADRDVVLAIFADVRAAFLELLDDEEENEWIETAETRRRVREKASTPLSFSGINLYASEAKSLLCFKYYNRE